MVYCNVIAVCLEVSDVGRLGEWNDAARQWCDSLPSDAPFPAICRVHRAEAASLRAASPEAEAARRPAWSFQPGAMEHLDAACATW